MKIYHFFPFVLLFSVLFYFNSCSNDTTVTPPVTDGQGITQTVTSNDKGNISFDNFKLVFAVGTVPLQQNGSAGTVVFSMNSMSSMPSGLTSLPSGYTQIGKFLQAGPDNFIFNSTIQVYMP